MTRGLGMAGWLVCALVFGSLTTRPMGAQDVRYLRHQAWSTEEGLVQDSVHGLLQTAEGFLWVATEGGVARFDGVSFRTYSSATDAAFTSNDACCLAEGAAGEVWVGTSDGLVKLAGGRAQRYGVAEGLPAAEIRGVVGVGDGELLVLTAKGLVRWAAGGFREVKGLTGEVTAMAAASGGGAWLTVGRRAVLWRDGRVMGEVTGPGGAEMEGVAEGDDGAVWTYTRGAVAVRRGVAERRWTAGAELRGSRVEALSVGADGTAWVGTNDGLELLRSDGAVTPVGALEGNTVLAVMRDREGDVWVGTETSGLHVLRAGRFRGVAGLRERSITGVVQATDGAVWVGTWNDGLRRLEDAGEGEPMEVRGGASAVILSLTPAADGGVWAGTPDGLELVDRAGRVRRTVTLADGLPDDYVESLAGEPGGGVWVGTRHGLVEVRAGTVRDGAVREEAGAEGGLVGALLRTSGGELWVVSPGGLLRRGVDGEIRRYGGGVVTAMAEGPGGEVWVAGAGGEIGLVSGGEIRPAHALTGERVAAMLVDGGGTLWVRGKAGIYRLALGELRRSAAGDGHGAVAERRYGRGDGLPSDEMAEAGSPMLWRMADGEIWVATRRGVAITDPAMVGSGVSPRVVVERFLMEDRALVLGGGPVKLRAGSGRLTMEYAGLSFAAPGEVRYRFRLEGFDAGWTEAGARRSATYTNLPPGRYVFRVEARRGDGAWGESAALKFRVIPPIWKTWWALVLEVLVLAGLVSWAYWLRLRAVRRRFEGVLKERSRIAREIHDTLAQDFVGVTLQLDLVAQGLGSERVEAGTRVRTALEQIASTRRLVTEGLAEARQSIWALRSNLAADSLPNGLRRLVDRYGGGGVAVRLVIEGAYRELGREVERELLRIAGEALANAERHAGATEATVALGYGREVVRLRVEDNGRGFDVEEARRMEGHYGLRGLEERARVIGGELEIESAAGVGTTVRLAVPVKGE